MIKALGDEMREDLFLELLKTFFISSTGTAVFLTLFFNE